MPEIPEEGDPGWISDEVMATLQQEQDRLRFLKMDALIDYTKQAKAWLTKLWDDIPVQLSWRKMCKAACTYSQQN